MQYLPSEVLGLISSNLHREDIPNFRLTSRLLARIGIHHLTVKGHFCFRKHSLERLRRIAQHPILSRNLHEIVFFVDVVQTFNSKHAWEHQAQATCRAIPKNDHLATQWLQDYPLYAIIPLTEVRGEKFKLAAWQSQKQIQREQDELLRKDACTFESMRRSLAMLRNLKAFSMETFGTCHRELMYQLYILDTCQAWYCFNHACAFKSFQQVSLQLFNTVLTSNNIEEPSKLGGFQLSMLKIYATDFANFEQHTLDVPSYTMALKKVRNIVLRSIYLKDMFTTEQLLRLEKCSDEKNGPFIQQILSKTPNLETLSLAITAKPDLSSQTIFRNCIWAKLHRLDLYMITIDKASFESFLSSHRRCLRKLHLYSMDITGSSQGYAWIELFSFMRHSLFLRDLSLGGILYDVNRGAGFDHKTTHTLNSGRKMTIENIARFLVCGRLPVALDEEVCEDGELLDLDWHVLCAAYVDYS